MRYKNAKQYWKLLKKANNVSQCNISLSKFTCYFKAVYHSENHLYESDDDDYKCMFMNEIQVMFNKLDMPVIKEEIVYAIDQHTSGKSAGPDKILNELL